MRDGRRIVFGVSAVDGIHDGEPHTQLGPWAKMLIVNIPRPTKGRDRVSDVSEGSSNESFSWSATKAALGTNAPGCRSSATIYPIQTLLTIAAIEKVEGSQVTPQRKDRRQWRIDTTLTNLALLVHRLLDAVDLGDLGATDPAEPEARRHRRRA